MTANVTFGKAWDTLKETAGYTSRRKGRTYLKHRVDTLAHAC